MGFSESVKREALIAAGRHCCLCHRYKGVKVEVHHIVPEAQGGSNDEDNAIALCFDCHADAGHYDVKHPRGNRVRPEELRIARDRWHSKVESGEVETRELDEHNIACRYVVATDFTTATEVAEGSLNHFPFRPAYLCATRFSEFFQSIVRTNRSRYRTRSISGSRYQDSDSYATMFPDAEAVDGRDRHFPYYRLVRDPSEQEIMQAADGRDPVLLRMCESGLNVSQMANVTVYWNPCGDSESVLEEYRLPEIWPIFLVVTNLSGKPVRLDEVYGHEIGEEERIVPFDSCSKSDRSLKLPSAQITKGENVVVPIGNIVVPARHGTGEIRASWSEDVSFGESIPVVHTMNWNRAAENICVWDRMFLAQGLRYSVPDGSSTTDIHALDFSNLYMIDRNYAMGSCPHLFWQMDDGSVQYGGEILARADGRSGRDTAVVPAGSSTCIIAELEEERTVLRTVKLDEAILVEDKVLCQGDTVVLEVRSGSVIQFCGWYEPCEEAQTIRPLCEWASARNRIVAQGREQLESLAKSDGVGRTAPQSKS